MGETRPEPTPSGGAAGDGGNGGEDDMERLRHLAMFVPRLLKLLGKLVVDPEVPAFEKFLLGMAVLYVLSPIDIVPDTIPILGQLDDLYLIALCLLRLLHRSGEDRLRRNWDGPEDIVELLHTVSDLATRYLPGPARDKIRRWVEVRAASSGESGPSAPSGPSGPG